MVRSRPKRRREARRETRADGTCDGSLNSLHQFDRERRNAVFPPLASPAGGRRRQVSPGGRQPPCPNQPFGSGSSPAPSAETRRRGSSLWGWPILVISTMVVGRLWGGTPRRQTRPAPAGLVVFGSQNPAMRSSSTWASSPRSSSRTRTRSAVARMSELKNRPTEHADEFLPVLIKAEFGSPLMLLMRLSGTMVRTLVRWLCCRRRALKDIGRAEEWGDRTLVEIEKRRGHARRWIGQEATWFSDD